MKKIGVLMGLITVLAVSCSTGIVGDMQTVNGKTYIVPFSRDSRANTRIDENGRKYKEKFINEMDKSNEIIVYSKIDDAPARHCLGKDGHPIIKIDPVTKEYERICRLDTPGSRVEGSEIEVDEIDYYAANTENKYVYEKTIEKNQDNSNKKVFSDEEYTKYAKYTRPTKREEIRRRYLEPKEDVQAFLKALYKKRIKEQYNIDVE